jgi:hypothetical protein
MKVMTMTVMITVLVNVVMSTVHSPGLKATSLEQYVFISLFYTFLFFSLILTK